MVIREQGAGSRVQDSGHTEAPPTTETIRVSTANLNSIFLQAEELLFTKLAVAQRVAELEEVKSIFAAWGREWAKVHPEVKRLRHSLGKEEEHIHTTSPPSPVSKVLEFLDWNHSYLKSQENKLTALVNASKSDHHALSRMVDTLLEDMRKVLMLPLSSVLELFPKLVRDLSRDQGKEVELVIRGGEVEIDRRILEEVKSPLIHLVRNCVDHGIEPPKERIQNNKPLKGVITIAVEQKGNQAEILIADDGSGIDPHRIKAAALRLGVLAEEEADKLPDSKALSFIFRSGLSTSPIITDVSGRGLGLTIVREKVENLEGAVSFETSPGAGTTFRLVLPLTLATFRGVIVRCADRLFILPTAAVERVVRINAGAVKTVENRETIELESQAVSLVRLEEVLELSRPSRTNNSSKTLPVVIVASAGQQIALLVDEVVNEQEVLQKNLGAQLVRVRNIGGAAVLGTGRVIPILYVPDLIKSAVQLSMAGARPASMAPEAEKVGKKAIIVVEDSITSRTLLKNILEVAGYNVAIATDGVDGFTQLKSGEFDVVVSDVDMPRMNGFDLTAKIRSDKKLADLPVVLVTALDSREDRKRGIEVGANAYIVKSNFDQSNLLEVVKRLI